MHRGTQMSIDQRNVVYDIIAEQVRDLGLVALTADLCLSKALQERAGLSATVATTLAGIARQVHKRLLKQIDVLITNGLAKVYDPTYGDDKPCVCGHPYYRHFDSYDNMRAVGCKYCSRDDCANFWPKGDPT